MSKLFSAIQTLIENGQIRISEHGYDELAEDGIYIREIVESLHDAIVIEEYPEYHKGHAILIKHYDSNNQPIHVVWGVPKGKSSPAVLVTAYRPDPHRWDNEFTKRII